MKKKLKILGFSLLFLLITFSINFSYANTTKSSDLLRVTFLNVGQGDCSIIRTPDGKVIMIDAGDDTEYAAEKYIIPYLEANDIKKIDTLVISHAHRDHIGGLLKIIPKYDIGKVYESKPSVTQLYGSIIKMLKQKNIPIYKAWKGDKLDFGNVVEALVLHPTVEWYNICGEKPPINMTILDGNLPIDTSSSTNNEENLNNFSVVVRLKYKNIVYHFAGDSEKPAEDYMIKVNSEELLTSTVYKVAHHGSKTSSDPLYLKKLNPTLSIISCGKDNKFKHPAPTTVQNLKYYSKNVLRTDEDGIIETWTDGNELYYSSNNSLNTLVSGPIVTNITPFSATIEWETTRLSTTKVKYVKEGSNQVYTKQLFDKQQHHKITLLNLTPNTTYNFVIESIADNEENNVITANGTFKTLSSNTSNIKIVFTSISPSPLYINEPVEIIAKIENAPLNSEIVFYEDSVNEKFKVGEYSISDGIVKINWVPTQSKHYELILLLKLNDNILAISSMYVNVGRKIILIDTAHKNYNFNKFESFKIDLTNRGYDIREIKTPITTELLKNASLLIISEPSTLENGFNPDEILAIKNFVYQGKSLLLIGRPDYDNYSQPQLLNVILEQIGSNIRINDDEVLDPTNSPGGTMTYLIFAHIFNRSIIQSDVKQVIIKGTASLLNSKFKPITPMDKQIIPLIWGDNDTYNINADGLNDGVIYPSGIPIIIDACEILPSGGKVAVFGGFHLDSGAYTYSENNQTYLYNYNVIKWLLTFAKREISDLSNEMVNISETTFDTERENSAIIGMSIRAQKIALKLLEEFDYSHDKIEQSLDKFIKFFENKSQKYILTFSNVIKKILDRVRYEAAENPELLQKIGPKIDILEQLYFQSIKNKK